MQAGADTDWQWPFDMPNEHPPDLSTGSPSSHHSSHPDTPPYGNPFGNTYFPIETTSLSLDGFPPSTQTLQPAQPPQQRDPTERSTFKAPSRANTSSRYDPYARPARGSRLVNGGHDMGASDTAQSTGGYGALVPGGYNHTSHSRELHSSGPSLGLAGSFGGVPTGGAPTTEDILIDPLLRDPPRITPPRPAVSDVVSVIRFTEVASGQAQTMISVRPSFLWSTADGLVLTDLHPMICTLQPGETVSRWQPFDTDQSELRHIIMDSAHIGLKDLGLATMTDHSTISYKPDSGQQPMLGISRGVHKALLGASDAVGERYASAMVKEGSRLPLIRELHLCSPGFPQLAEVAQGVQAGAAPVM